jgi:hypothetical protein
MLKDKMGQEIEEGTILIRPELFCRAARFRVVKVVEVRPSSFTYTTILPKRSDLVKLCRMPDECLVVPPIIANYWDTLNGG